MRPANEIVVNRRRPRTRMLSEIPVDEDGDVALGAGFPRLDGDCGAASVRRKDRGLHLRLSWTCNRIIPTAAAMAPGTGGRRDRAGDPTPRVGHNRSEPP